MYGPNDNFDLENSHVLAALIRKVHEAKVKKKGEILLWGSGNPRREFIFNNDAAESSVFAMLNADRLENSHYNIGVGIDYSIKELAEIIAKIVGFGGEIRWDTTKPDGTFRKLLDSSKFRNLGWIPSSPSLEAGLRTTYEWYLKTVCNGREVI